MAGMRKPNNDKVQMPAVQLPAYRTSVAIRDGVEKEILFTTWGGIGDQLCAEPTLRFAIDTFKDCRISLATEIPEVFAHLNFHKVFDLKLEIPDYDKFFVLETITHTESLTWQFMSHMVTHCVDFPSLCALRCQLPIAYKPIQISCSPPGMGSRVREKLYAIRLEHYRHVLIHAGRHWESKTFPKDWWDAVYDEVVTAGLIPVLIGKDVDFNVGVVDVKCDEHGIDLRNQCSLSETLWLCQKAGLMICSDSAPMHMAAPGEAHIAFVATVKHPDYITHWRRGGWGWRMKNFGKGGMWELMDYCPNKEQTIEVDKCPEEQLVKWLPEPKEIVEWIASRSNS
jgi:hypothetical protein